MGLYCNDRTILNPPRKNKSGSDDHLSDNLTRFLESKELSFLNVLYSKRLFKCTSFRRSYRNLQLVKKPIFGFLCLNSPATGFVQTVYDHFLPFCRETTLHVLYASLMTPS